MPSAACTSSAVDQSKNSKKRGLKTMPAGSQWPHSIVNLRVNRKPMSSAPLASMRRDILDQHGDALAAADTGRSNAVAQAAALQFARQGQRQPHAGRAKGMADGDGAAVE